MLCALNVTVQPVLRAST